MQMANSLQGVLLRTLCALTKQSFRCATARHPLHCKVNCTAAVPGKDKLCLDMPGFIYALLKGCAELALLAVKAHKSKLR